MLTTTVRGLVTAACAASLLALLGCGGQQLPLPPKMSPTAPASNTPVTKSSVPEREPRTLVLKATGEANVTSAKYTLDREVKKDGSVKLPWRKSVTVPADGNPHRWQLDVKFTGTGHVELVAIFDGSVVGRSGSAGSGAGVQGRARVGGTVQG